LHGCYGDGEREKTVFASNPVLGGGFQADNTGISGIRLPWIRITFTGKFNFSPEVTPLQPAATVVILPVPSAITLNLCSVLVSRGAVCLQVGKFAVAKCDWHFGDRCQISWRSREAFQVCWRQFSEVGERDVG